MEKAVSNDLGVFLWEAEEKAGGAYDKLKEKWRLCELVKWKTCSEDGDTEKFFHKPNNQ